MAGGKKAKRGGTAKKRQLEAAASAIERNTAFIETSDGPERVFPLEVRKEIYRYLLLSCNVKKQRDSSLWNTKGFSDYYEFKVNILRTNKAVYAEAREVLYGENVFIVLSTKEHAIRLRLRLHAVPIVSEDFAAVERFSEHSLHMRFEGPLRGSPAGEHMNCKCAACRAPAPEKRMLLLLDDLPAFICICRVLNHVDPDPTLPIVDSPRDGTFSYRRLCEARQPSSVVIKFRNNTYGLTTPNFVEQTLAQLRKVAGDRHVEIIAPSHPWLAAECKEAMMPKVVWGYAVGWDLIEVARELKVAANEMVKRCSSERAHADILALKLYDEIFLLLGNSMIFRRLGAVGDAFTYESRYCKHDVEGCWCLDWLESWTLLNLDLAIAAVVLNLFSGSDESAALHEVDVFKFRTQSFRVPVETTAHASHVMAFAHARRGVCREALTSLKDAQTRRQIAGLEADEGLEQDIEKQVKHVKHCNAKHRAKDDRICLCCSPSFAGKSCEAKESPFDGAKPVGIFAWQDYDHQLTEDNLKAMGLTKKDVPPGLQRDPQAMPSTHPSDEMEAMDLSS